MKTHAVLNSQLPFLIHLSKESKETKDINMQLTKAENSY